MIDNKGNRLVISINDLRNQNRERAMALLQTSFEEISAFQRALKEFVGSIDATFAKESEDFYIGFEGSFGSKHVTPRTLTATNLGNLVCLEGIITKCSLVRPKVRLFVIKNLSILNLTCLYLSTGGEKCPFLSCHWKDT